MTYEKFINWPYDATKRLRKKNLNPSVNLEDQVKKYIKFNDLCFLVLFFLKGLNLALFIHPGIPVKFQSVPFLQHSWEGR